MTGTFGDGFGLSRTLGPDADAITGDQLDIDERSQVVHDNDDVTGVGAEGIDRGA